MSAPWHLTAAEMDAAWDEREARLAEAERDRDMWHARAISLFWNPGEVTTCAAVRTDADLAMEWIKSGNKASDSAPAATRRPCPVCQQPLDDDEILGSCMHGGPEHRRVIVPPVSASVEGEK